MSPHTEGRKTGTPHTDKTVDREGGTGEGKQPLRRVPLFKETLIKRKTTTIPFGLRTCGVLVHAHILKSLTAMVRLVVLVDMLGNNNLTG